ncbi:hypothetical protein JCM16303_000626 [Sporobolomyces ruberrimus]
MSTVKCTRNGCGKQFDPSKNDSAECSFHPGHPVFHEGLKSWSCCASSNKPTTEFDDFMKFEPCATGTHSSEKPEPVVPATSSSSTSKEPSSTSGSTETYGSVAPLPPPPPPSTSTANIAPPKPTSTAYVEEQDDPEVKISKGTTCKRKSCGTTYEGDEMERGGEECRYHPGAPIFHEGSKGFSCCKRRVLEFDEFLRIEGCKTGRHLFAGAKKSDEDVEEQVECRIDHYQTPRQVIVSVFGKQADKEKSTVTFEDESMTIDLILPSRKRFTRTLSLYGPITPSTSTYKILGTKCEITLSKADARSWPTVTALDPTLSKNFVAQLAFSAGGGRGTCGAKEPVLDETNKRS